MAEVEGLVAAGDLQKLTGDAANGERLLEKAVVTLETARSAIERDPDSASMPPRSSTPLRGLLDQLGLF